MRFLAPLRSFARAVLLRSRMEREMDREMRFHIEARAADLEAAGVRRADAERQACREFGDMVRWKEAARDARGLRLIDDCRADLVYAGRVIRRAPAFAAVVIGSLALGIGANTTIFSFINAVSLKTLPVSDPRELVIFSVVGSDESLSYPMYQQFMAAPGVFTGLAATGGMPPMRMTVSGVSGGTVTEIVQAQPVSGNLFAVLGVSPALGRTLNPDDDVAGDPRPVAVISHELWTRQFGRDPAVVGRRIVLNDVPLTIVGVTRSGFRAFEASLTPDLWWPLQMFPRVYPGNQRLNSRGEWLHLIGRLAPGVSRDRARAEMSAIFQRDMAETFQRRVAAQGDAFIPSEREIFLRRSLELLPGSTGWSALRRQFQQPLVILLALVGVVLLIACANAANLLLARAAVRRHEIAMRLALGAARGRVIRQLLTEGVLLALTAGLAGLLISLWATRFLSRYLPYPQLVLDIDPDVRVLGFTVAVSALTGFVFSLVPALRATRPDIVSGIRDRRIVRSRASLNHALAIVQVALSIVLVCGASLFARTLWNFESLELGFDREDLTVFDVGVPASYDMAARSRLYGRILQRLETTPGVRKASYSAFGNLSGSNWSERVLIAGYSAQPGENLTCRVTVVGPQFFETLGTRILSGRPFGPFEDGRTSHTAIINVAMAHRFFGDSDPIGRRFTVSGWGTDPYEIVGVAADATYRTLREPIAPAFVIPFHPSTPAASTRVIDGGAGMRFAMRTAGRVKFSDETIRQALQEVDDRAAVFGLQTMHQVVESATVQERLLSQLTSVFTTIALLLAAIGVYGVRSYAVAERMHEFGIRVAVGASRSDIFRMIFRDSLAVVAAGVAIGLPLALIASRAVESFLFGASARDPITLIVVIGVVTSIGLVASHLPARRASRIDPMVALRHE